jgi:trans-aconitate methyltransferase
VKGLDIAEAMLQQARDRLITAERAKADVNYSYTLTLSSTEVGRFMLPP